jgi:hypothetical protein
MEICSSNPRDARPPLPTVSRFEGALQPTIRLRSAVLCITATLSSFFAAAAFPATGGDGNVVVRIDDPFGSHCIDATKEQITVFLRRVFTEKKDGLFFDQNKAGVLVRTTVKGDDGAGNSPTVQVPSVDIVSVKDEANGRVSLALEYPVAADLPLAQGNTVTQFLSLVVNQSKPKSKSAFGNVLEIAGGALGQSILPSNPYTIAANKLLKFANDTIDKSISADNQEEIAQIGLKFMRGSEPDLDKCSSSGNERTGALLALRSIGKSGAKLIPMTDTEKQYCFSYTSKNTYEATAAPRKPDGTCPDLAQYSGINNDYVMLLLSANIAQSAHLGASRGGQYAKEARDRCDKFKVSRFACGVK